MFTMTKIPPDGERANSLNADYFVEYLMEDDYYSENNAIAGEWFGCLADELNLRHQGVSTEQLLELSKNKWYGKQLTQKETKVKFFGFQAAPPKSVSIMAVAMDDIRIKEAHKQCVKLALAELEKLAAVRLRKKNNHNSNNTEITGKLLASLFTHESSRALDPQLHTHCLVANFTQTETGETFALTEKEMIDVVGYAGRFYQNFLASKLKNLGYKIKVIHEKNGISFEIDGVDKKICEIFSKRTEELNRAVEKMEKELGRSLTNGEIQTLAKDTKKAKKHNSSSEELRSLARKQLTQDEYAKLQKLKYFAELKAKSNPFMGKMNIATTSDIEKHISSAIQNIFERNSVAKKYEILEEALKLSLGRFSFDELTNEVDRQLIKLKNDEKEALKNIYSTAENIAIEKDVVSIIQQGLQKFPSLGSQEKLIIKFDDKVLSDCQAIAVKEIIANNDFCQIFRGIAGSGKTTTLQVLNKTLEDSKKNIIYLAPSRAAVNVLKDEGFKNASTATQFLLDTNKNDGRKAKLTIKSNDVIVIDEASMLSMQTGHQLLTIAQNANARVVLVGDSKQHVAVDAGDFLRVLENHANIKITELTEIRRQQPEDYKLAISTMATGQTANGLQVLNQMGCIKECQAKYLDNAALAYAKKIVNGNSAILVAPTHREIDSITSIVRSHLKKANIINENSGVLQREIFYDYQYSNAQKNDIGNYQAGMMIVYQDFRTKEKSNIKIQEIVAEENLLKLDDGRKIKVSSRNIQSVGVAKELEICPGDKLLITANVKELNLTNGDFVDVKAIYDGKIYTNKGVLPLYFKNFKYGYAVTSHKSQGQTADSVIFAAEKVDAKSCYVGASRGRQTIEIFTPDFNNLLNNVRKQVDRQAVLDII